MGKLKNMTLKKAFYLIVSVTAVIVLCLSAVSVRICSRIHDQITLVIKYHGSQKYTTDAVSAAVMKKICERAGVPWQTYANRSDIAGGSTLGNLSAAQVPVSTVDIGLPQLAMHSAYETAGAKDVEYMIRAMECFYKE